MGVRTPSVTLLALVGLALAALTVGPASAQWTRRPYGASRFGGNYMHAYLLPPAPSATPWAPAWAPDGRSLAVGMAGSIWRVDADTGASEELTAGSTYHSSPTWSPDGRWIVYTADDSGRTIQLEALNVATGETHALTSEQANHTDPVYSPDGTRLAYAASLPNGALNVFVRPIRDGKWAGEPVQVTFDGSFSRDRPYFTTQDLHITPSWLSNGRELLLVSNRNVPLGSGHIVRVPAEARGLERATVIIDEQTLYQARPVASPDDTRIAFVSSSGGTEPWNTLNVIPAGLGNTVSATRLVSGAFDVFFPRWSPDGRAIAMLDNESGVPELAVVDAATGARRRLAITSRKWRRPTGTIGLRIVDAANNRQMPARVHVAAGDGRFYAPHNAYARLTWAGDRVYHSPGSDAIDVPAGKTTLEIVRGFEYAPVRLDVTVEAGKTSAVTASLSRVANLAADGWYSGSTGAHMHGGGLLRYGQEHLLLQADAEDLAVVNNALAHQERRIQPRELFRWGQAAHALSTRERLLVLGQEARPPFHGHVAVFGDPQPLPQLFPVTIGYEAAPPPTLAPSNTEMLRAAKARGALTSYVHAFSGEADPMEAGLGLGKAFMVDAALGLADTVEWASASRGAFVPWYAALNNGLKVTAIGGEDTISNLHIMRLLGCVRTYVYTGARGLTADAWWDGVRRGHTFVTTGPLVGLTVDGRKPGETVELSSSGEVHVRGWVRSITPLQRVLVVANGQVVAESPLDGNRTAASVDVRVPVTRSSWIHLRAEGAPPDRGPLDALYAQAFTNPVWISVGGRAVRDSASASYALRWIDMLQLMADAWPGWTSVEEKQRVFADFEAARVVYRRFQAEAQALTNGRH
jgi:TolB protein